jgi:hypothetical protein
MLKTTIAEKDREIATLKAKLAKSEDGWVPYDLKGDTADIIGRVQADTIGEDKFDAICKAAKARYKAKKKLAGYGSAPCGPSKIAEAPVFAALTWRYNRVFWLQWPSPPRRSIPSCASPTWSASCGSRTSASAS